MVSGATSDTTYYMGAFEYKNDRLNQVFTEEGRIRYDDANDAYNYDYYLKDHLGNIRVVFTGDGNGNAEALQVNNYYPFGMRFNQAPEKQSQSNDYLYNGKELQKFGLNWYDYGARFYDPALARWHSIDPRSEELNNLTPYNYVANSPIIANDPDGEFLNIVIGAVVGAATEMTSQMVTSMTQGESFRDAFKNMDWGDVGIGAGEGALVATGVGAVAVGVGGAIAKSSLDIKKGTEGFEVNAIGAGKTGETFGKDLVSNLAGVGAASLVPTKSIGNFVADKMAGSMLKNGTMNSVEYLVGHSVSELTKGISEGIADGIANGLWNKAYGNYLYRGSYLRPYKVNLPPIIVVANKKTKTISQEEQKKIINHIKEHGYKSWLEKFK